MLDNNKIKGDHIIVPIQTIVDANIAGITNGKAILLLAKIQNLCQHTGKCYPTNGYLSDILQVDERSVQKYLAELKEAGFIKTYNRKVGEKKSVRTIYLQ